MARMGRSAPSRGLDVAGVCAVVAMGAGPLLAWLRVVSGLSGFVVFALGGLLATLVSLAAVVQAVRGHGFSRARMLTALAGLGFVALAAGSRGAPAINDFTTDLDDPPAFTHAAALGANRGRDLAYPPAFAAVQRSCCADLGPVTVHRAPPEAFELARRVAVGMPAWTVTWADPTRGLLEATSTSQVFGFVDDVVIRVRPDASGAGASRVDMRSKSRDGRGDMGVNANRIRAYAAALAMQAGNGG
ncbi:MAG: DUF1499 domain-containing protein [bacterium]|nr:DUF1499 domain-containing protein [bacterium]